MLPAARRKCAQADFDRMQRAVQQLDFLGQHPSGYIRRYLVPIAHWIWIARSSRYADTFFLNAGLGGEIHAWLISFGAIEELSVFDSNDNESQRQVGFSLRLEGTGLEDVGAVTASRVIMANAGEQLSLRVRGTGCTALIVARYFVL